MVQKDYTPYENIKHIAPNILMESESHSEAQIDKGKIMSDLGGKVMVMPTSTTSHLRLLSQRYHKLVNNFNRSY